ncbi:Phosphoribosylaminoimidazole-succinocarboxamide synthase [Morus notabilis]|uniref:Phosphoribosylaminoimidazole-succinocarboxamide synthase, chloroplastic n=2 Tax=Morus notabilis TaxID=981085 RepID=W9RG16_9ROSA|nr:Phosphoribosylaminoimidazole-succinocarboxamide synthase [Morus notabilis]
MAESTRGLNPPKTLKPKFPIRNTLLSSIPHFTTTTKSNSKKLSTVSLSIMADQNQRRDQKPLTLDAFGNGPRKEELFGAITKSLAYCLSETNLQLTVPGLKSKTRGKVRDIYDSGDYLVLVTTDRLSAFDRILASIPFKGQVLNQASLWWFDNTLHITPNAVVLAPDENVTIAKKCSVFPVEFVVRGYVTGSTDTSLWTVYKKGVRNYCGNALPEGLVKNQKLPANILTPTTKAADHDVPVTPDEIISSGLMTEADYEEASRKALSLFEYGQRVAREHGLILVDTKYEFGKGRDGSILLIDEVHTPDSSRYWIAHSYEERFKNGLEPENVDKEFLRLWFKDHCDPYKDKVLPDAPEELVSELAWRYIFLYETITKFKFKMPSTEEPIHDRISRKVALALSSLKVHWALKLKGVEYEYLEEHLPNKSPLLLKYNPVHEKVPVLVHNGKPLAESLVIMEYIDETWEQNPCVPAMISAFSKTGDEKDKAAREARENLKILESGLGEKQFFGGEIVGFVDIAAGWIGLWGRITEEVADVHLIDAETMPLLNAWLERVLEVPIFKECLPSGDKYLEHCKNVHKISAARSS